MVPGTVRNCEVYEKNELAAKLVSKICLQFSSKYLQSLFQSPAVKRNPKTLQSPTLLFQYATYR